MTPGMANVLSAIKSLSTKDRYGARVPANVVDGAYYARAVQGLIDRGLLALRSNPTHEDWWYEIVPREARPRGEAVSLRGKLGTHPTAVYWRQAAGTADLAEGSTIVVRSDMDSRVCKWTPVRIAQVKDIGGPFYLMELV